MSTTVVRRSSRAVKSVSYVAIAVESSGEEDTYAEPIIVSDGSEGEEEVVSKKRKRVSGAKSTKPTRPRNVPSVSTSLISGPFEEPHATSRHDPERLIPYLPALLEWFEEKRDVRGMPWRKRYDPNLSKEERAQRAYEVLVSEVCVPPIFVRSENLIQWWAADHAAANTSCDGHSVLQPMAPNVRPHRSLPISRPALTLVFQIPNTRRSCFRRPSRSARSLERSRLLPPCGIPPRSCPKGPIHIRRMYS